MEKDFSKIIDWIDKEWRYTYLPWLDDKSKNRITEDEYSGHQYFDLLDKAGLDYFDLSEMSLDKDSDYSEDEDEYEIYEEITKSQ